MGPLVPDIIGVDLNYVVALLVGIAFGWILEQAGFSTSRKLVGLFYGYDFTVLRVFFTAGVTAMAGVIALQHTGMLDIDLTYINPTFLWSALVGGVVMGLGFVLGGYCPGTSVCAAATGKLDAMLFVGGSFLGVFAFAEAYPLLKEFYMSASWGSPRIFETLGMSMPLFAFLLTAMALIAFWAVSLVESRVTGEPVRLVRLTRVTTAVGGIGVLIAVSGFALPTQREALLARANDPARIEALDVPRMTVDEFAFRLLDGDTRLRVVDFRPASSSVGSRLPRSVGFTTANLFEKEPSQLLDVRGMHYVFVAETEHEARRMALIARELGHERIAVLEGGFHGFEDRILHFPVEGLPDARPGSDAWRFRTRAREALPALIAASADTGPVKKKIKRAVGGC